MRLILDLRVYYNVNSVEDSVSLTAITTFYGSWW